VTVLGGVRLGGPGPPRLVGIINASPESFLASSVRATPRAISAAAARMEAEGADIIDIGGMSSAPYAATAVPERTEAERLRAAVAAAARSTGLPISADTARAPAAKAAIAEGAAILNDVTGLRGDARMARVVSRHSPSLILCAHSPAPVRAGDPVPQAAALLARSVSRAASLGVDPSRVAADPAIGFFRRSGRGRLFTRSAMDWAARDLLVLGGLRRLRAALPCEVLVSASNKSFLGRLMGGAGPAERLPASLAAEAAAAVNGAAAIRTHNVAQTREALRALRRA